MKSFFALFFGLLLSGSPVFAQEESPDALIKKVTEEVLTIVRQDKDIQSGNTRKAIELVEAKVLPNFNFQRMTALAMGRDWNKATPEQKKRLSDEFKTLLVRTYSNALTGYKDQTIRYKPTKMQSGDVDVVVRTEVLQPGGFSRVEQAMRTKKKDNQQKTHSNRILKGKGHYRDRKGLNNAE